MIKSFSQHITLKVLPIFLLLVTGSSFAQFTFVGDVADYIAPDTIILTTETNDQNGSAWFSETIDLDNSFSIEVILYFGNNNAGADGIAFGLQTTGTGVGEKGKGIGMGNLSPLLAVEFDTYKNFTLNDPNDDHIALVRDGDNNHNSPNNIAGPITPGNNFEDDNWHNAKFIWNAAIKKFDVYFDCNNVISETIDITNDIFSGQSQVYWGFTSATGGAKNKHQVGIKELSFFNSDTLHICEGDPLLIAAPTSDNAANYIWYSPNGDVLGNNSSIDINPTKDTSVYTVTFTQDNPCVRDQLKNYIVIVDKKPTSFLNDTSNCASPTILDPSLSLTNPTYQWYDQIGPLALEINPTISVDDAGLYWVEVTYEFIPGKFCTASDTSTVSVPEILKPNLGIDTASCELPILISDQDLSSVTYDFQWLYNDAEINLATSRQYNAQNVGSYILRVDSSQCTNADTIEVSLYPLPVPKFVDPTLALCPQVPETYTAELHVGSTYQWKLIDPNGNVTLGSTTNQQELVLENDPITLRIIETSINGCVDSTDQLVGVIETPVPEILPDQYICLNDTQQYSITGYPGTSDIVWSILPNNQDIVLITDGGQNNDETIELKGIKVGEVKLTVIETRNTCILHDTLDIEVRALPEITIDPIDPLCLNEAGGTDLVASPADGSFSGLGVIGNQIFASSISANADTTTKVYYDVTDDFGCSNKDSLEINFIYVPEITINTEQPIICEGTTINLTLTPYDPNFTYTWYRNNISIQQNLPQISISEDGVYHVIINKTKCQNKSNNLPISVTSINVTTDGPFFIKQGTSQTINAFPNRAATLVWYVLPDSTVIGNQNPISVRPNELTEYAVIATSIEGCKDIASTSIEIYRPITIPEIISPNGDGLNDTWRIEHLDDYPSNTVKLFNRWGNVIYKKEGYLNDWDGVRNGEDLPVATYYYHVSVEQFNGEGSLDFYGSLTIIK